LRSRRRLVGEALHEREVLVGGRGQRTKLARFVPPLVAEVISSWDGEQLRVDVGIAMGPGCAAGQNAHY
jgi:hypothetical protein